MKLPNKIALVTGGARRIGAAIVEALHGAQYNVIIHCHQSRREADALAHRLNQARKNSAWVLEHDLHRDDAADALIKHTIDFGKRLDVLVNNASAFIRSDLSLVDEWDELFTINVKRPFLLSLKGRPYLEETKGSIINITDIHAKNPLKDYAVYCQTKAALWMQTKALAREFAPKVRVNAVAPGAIMWPEKANALCERIQQDILAKTPLKCHGSPEFIALAVLSLIENPFITGEMLSVDGGRSI